MKLFISTVRSPNKQSKEDAVSSCSMVVCNHSVVYMLLFSLHMYIRR